MQVIETRSRMRAVAAGWRQAGESVALVTLGPGTPHRGHLALVARARAEAGRTVVARLGTDDEVQAADNAVFRDAGVDVVFSPRTADFAVPGAETFVEPSELSRILAGKQRPTLFRGIATTAARLFNIIQPNVACYGEKHYQQLCVIKRMVRDLDVPVRILGIKTVRDADGLALSGRNRFLTEEQRDAALVLHSALQAAVAMAETGITASRLRSWVAATLQAEPRAAQPGVDIRDAETLDLLSGPFDAPAVLLVSARFGRVVLTDHAILSPGPSAEAGGSAP